MKMLVLIYRDSLQEEVLSLLKNEKIQEYTMIPKVHGMEKPEQPSVRLCPRGKFARAVSIGERAGASDDRGDSGASNSTLPVPAGRSGSHETDGDALRGDHLTRRIDPATSSYVVRVEDSPIS